MAEPKVVACIIARTVSTRLPLKILRDVSKDLSLIDFLILRLKSVKRIDEIYLCTSEELVDDILEDVAQRNKIKIYRGSATNVMERILSVGNISNADILLRITGDNPLTAVEYIEEQVNFIINNNLDYVRLIDVPIGATAEVATREAFIRCNEIMDPSVSEYLMLFLFDPKNFNCGVIKPFQNDYSTYSLTVDTPDDLIRTKNLVGYLDKSTPSDILLKDIIEVYSKEKVQLPAKKMKLSGKIKLPYDKYISVEDFKLDMNYRVRSSKMLQLYAS